MKNYRKPHRMKRKKPVYKNKVFGFAVIFLALFAVILYLSCFLPKVQIEEIRISGNQKIQTDAIKNYILAEAGKSIMFLPSKSIFLFSPKKAEENILAAFSQIDKIKIDRDFFNTLDVVVAERKPSAFFCRQENCFLIDEQGVAFERGSSTEGLLKISDEQNSDSLELFGQALGENDLSKILLINSKLKNDLGIDVGEFLISSQDRLIALTKEGWNIYFYLKGDVDWQLTKLKAVLDEKIPQEKRKNLEYIELRFENLAPFKYKDK